MKRKKYLQTSELIPQDKKEYLMKRVLGLEADIEQRRISQRRKNDELMILKLDQGSLLNRLTSVLT